MQKKGQVTIFVIVGIIILILAGSFFVYQNFIKKTELEKTKQAIKNIPQTFATANNIIIRCIKENTIKSLPLVIMQGGYANPEKYTRIYVINPQTESAALENIFAKNSKEYDPYFKITLWSENNKDISPAKKDIESSMNSYIASRIFSCAYLIPEEFEINNTSYPDINTTITQRAIEISINYPIQITKGSAVFNTEKQTINIKSDLYNLFSFAKKVNEDFISTKGLINLNKLQNSDYRINMLDYTNSTVFTISSNQTTLNFASRI